MRHFKPLYLTLMACLAALLLVACKNEGEDPEPLVIPDRYDGSAFATNAATEIDVVDRLGDLASEMQAGRDAANTVNAAGLQLAYDLNTPSLSSLTTSYYRRLVEAWFLEIEAASGQAYDLDNAPAGDGGVLGGYLFKAQALELEQMVEKGLFGAALYQHAVSLMQGTLTAATPDQLIAIFGAHPDFANSDNSDLHAHPDRAMANYAARRDPADGTGFYTTLRDAFIQLQAAIQAGEAYQVERDEALATIQQTWEQANAATVINYLYATVTKLSVTDPSDAQVGSAMHSYSEAVGFLHGWKGIDANYRRITDADIDALLILLNAPADAQPTSYLLFTDSFNQLPQLTQAIEQLQDIYGFSDAQLESFKFNYVSQQER
jgi:hypothetical protein